MILIGTSGFSYDDWCGRWYPPGISKGDMLEYYASVFDALEINAVYYHTPGRKTAESMVRRAAGRLKFAIKAPGPMTHANKLTPDVVDPWRHFLDPFREANAMIAALLQFPNRFHQTPQNWEYLEELRRLFPGMTLALEFRHATWDDGAAEQRLGEMEFCRVMVDQPDIRGLSLSLHEGPAHPLAYFRYHGRNAKSWYNNTNGEGRYNYRYSETEIDLLAGKVRDLDTRAESTVAFFNNHPNGEAPANAETLAQKLNVPLRGSGYKDLFS